MIIKSLRHTATSAKYSVDYVFNGIPKEQKDQWVVFQNITEGFSRESIINEFNTNAGFLSKNLQRQKTIRYHEILGFSHANSLDLTREKQLKIAHKYLQLRDPENSSQAICVPHMEKHVHIHILLTSNYIGSNKSGDMRMSNARYYDIRREMERWMLKTYPELHHSTVYLSNEEVISLLPEKYKEERRMIELTKSKPYKNSVKQHVSEIIQKILEQSKSLEDFTERINKIKKFTTYSRRGKLTGVIHENKKKFRFSNLGINLLEENFKVLSRLSELKAINERESFRSLER